MQPIIDILFMPDLTSIDRVGEEMVKPTTSERFAFYLSSVLCHLSLRSEVIGICKCFQFPNVASLQVGFEQGSDDLGFWSVDDQSRI